MNSRDRAILSATSLPLISDVAAIAPVFTIGLKGRFRRSSKTMALNLSPGRFDPDPRQDRIAAMILKREAVEQGLGNRLHCEGPARVAYFIGIPIGSDESDPELVGGHPAKLRDVSCHLAFSHRQELHVNFAQQLEYG